MDYYCNNCHGLVPSVKKTVAQIIQVFDEPILVETPVRYCAVCDARIDDKDLGRATFFAALATYLDKHEMLNSRKSLQEDRPATVSSPSNNENASHLPDKTCANTSGCYQQQVRFDIDDVTISGPVEAVLDIIHALGYHAKGCPPALQFDHKHISQWRQRQAKGIAIAKAQGRYKGRQPIQVNQEAFVREYQAWREGKQTARETMGKLGLRPNTFYRRVKAYEQEQR